MASTFFGLNIAGSGLRAANASINTASNNIANKDTKGYSRQQTVQQAADALRTFTKYGCAGAGVETLAIERVRDAFYDVKYRENETRYGEYNTKNYYMQLLQTYFEDDGKTGFSTIFTNLKAGIEEVMKNAGDSTTKKDFLGTVEKLVEYFNTTEANLERLQKDVNDEIKVKVDEMNSIAQEIQTLNQQINVVEMTAGSNANELRDKRDLLVDQLSKIVDVKVTESAILDSNDPDRETGATRYIVRIAGGQILVDGNRRSELVCQAREPNDKVNQSDIKGLYDIVWVDTGDRFATTNSRIGGELAGLLQLRDGNNKESFYGTVSGAEYKDGKQTVTVDVTADHLTDLNKCALAGSGTIDIGNVLYKYDGWTFNAVPKKGSDGSVMRDGDGNVIFSYSYTFTLRQKVDISLKEKSASVGNSIDYQGIPYYQEQMNEWIRLFAQKTNSILKSGYTDDGNPGCQMFTYDFEDNGKLVEGKFDHATDVSDPADPKGKSEDLFSGDYKKDVESYQVSNTDDSYYRLTAGTLTILDALKKNVELLGVKGENRQINGSQADGSQTDGESQYHNMSFLLKTLTNASMLSFRAADAGEFLTCVLGDITVAAGSAKTFGDNYGALQHTFNNQRLSISGVDEDEEALNVVHLQDSYTLACKLITTFSEIYDVLIRETGV